ncbi:MAG TPA: alpha/beta fold hydrolase [Vicinamibacteria bacterium]|nr:alpha/beta fold hydrolase [Vicinamibacteria bacterium]
MAANETFFVAGPSGRLEALLIRPETPAIAAAVVCHAHPQHGGMMHFKVVFRAAKALQHHGVAALRFNFRGVGLSEGKHDDGRGEQDDARAALDEMARRFPGLPLVIGGFSFGSAMALAVAARDPRVRAAFALGYPIVRVADTSHLAGLTVPRLFVQGEHDAFGSGPAIESLVASLAGPKELHVIPGSDHFFDGHLAALQSRVEAWAARRPWNA